MQKQEHLDPDLAGSWFKLLSQFPTDFPGAWLEEVERVIQQHFSLAVDCLNRQEDDLLRGTLAFARAALVRTLHLHLAMLLVSNLRHANAWTCD